MPDYKYPHADTAQIGHDYALWVRRVTSMARTLMDLYIGIKKREPVYIGLGIASLVETADSWFASAGPNIDKELRKMGLRPVLVPLRIERFVYYTVKTMDIPYTVLSPKGARKGGPNETIVKVYKLGSVDVFFVFDGSMLDAVYAKDEDALLIEFSKAVREHMGQLLTLTVSMESWNAYLHLAKLNIPMDGFVSPGDTDDYLETVKKFQELNKIYRKS